jgi:SAM-dependent methyltransferase
LTEEEVAWHEMWARRTGGPLLGLACGTGRLLCRLAQAEYDVTGLDLSMTMLGVARRQVGAMPVALRRRVTLVQGDMAAFDLGRRFGMIFIADKSFRELETRSGLLACLRCVRRHLAPQGRLLVTERRFNPSLFQGGRRSFGWSAPRPHPRTGQMVSRRGEFRLSRDGRRMRGEFVYRTLTRTGRERLYRCPMSAPIMTIGDYGLLFNKAGFDWQLFGGYREAPDVGNQPILCFVCTPRK